MDRTQNGLSIVVEGVRHVYKGGAIALDGVDLNIGTGLFGLLGPNGIILLSTHIVEAYLAFMASRGRTQDVSASGEDVAS